MYPDENAYALPKQAGGVLRPWLTVNIFCAPALAGDVAMAAARFGQEKHQIS